MASAYDDLVLEPRGGHEEYAEWEPFRHSNRSLSARMQYLSMRALQITLRRAPRFVQEGFISLLARFCRLVDRRHTNGAADYIRTALPAKSPAEVRALVLEAWRHLFRIALTSDGLVESLIGRPLGEHFDVDMSAEARAVLEGGGGCLLVTAHVGDWEAPAIALNTMGFVPIFGIGKAPRNDFLAQHIQRMREKCGGRLLARKGAMRTVPAVVRKGASVVLLLDHRARVKPVIAPFFGRPARCDRSAGVLVRRVRAPLVFFACYATDVPKKFRLELGAVVQPADLLGLDAEGMASRINQELEKLILARPEQYFWLHDRFKGMPPAPGTARADSANSAQP